MYINGHKSFFYTYGQFESSKQNLCCVGFSFELNTYVNIINCFFKIGSVHVKYYDFPCFGWILIDTCSTNSHMDKQPKICNCDHLDTVNDVF